MADFDALVVGLGPAGATAAREMAGKGLKVLAIDKERFPRKKSCGGCISTKIDSILDFSLDEVTEDIVYGIDFNFKGGRPIRVMSDRAIAYNVDRLRFDAFLVGKAREAGVEVIEGERVIGCNETCSGVEVETSARTYKAGFVVGAAGAGGIIGREKLGLDYKYCHLSLATDIKVTEEELAPLRGRCTVDFGTIPHGYGWIFPKKDTLNVGIAGLRPKIGGGAELKRAFNLFVNSYPLLRGRQITGVKGWTIPVYGGPKNNVVDGRVLIAGDSAHMVDPFLGEGIYYAIRSGQLAASAVAEAASGGKERLTLYNELLDKELYPDFEAKAGLVKVIYNYPRLWYKIVEREPRVMERYYNVLRGEEHCADFYSALKSKVVSKPWRVVSSLVRGASKSV